MKLVADCEKIRRNARAVVELCGAYGIEVAGVTKCCCGEPEVGRAMLAGGCTMLADSRLPNIKRLREAGIEAPVMLLRLPSLAEAHDVVRLADYSLNSEAETVRALSRAAQHAGVVHAVVLMVDTGDRREGVQPQRVVEVCRELLELPAIELAGLGTSLNCLCGVCPTPENQQYFADVVEMAEAELSIRFKLVSGGHTGNLHLVKKGQVPKRFNHFRVGEAILTGTDFSTWAELPMPHRDTFKVYADVVEVQDKPSAPEGIIGPDAFMEVREWPDRGVRRRAIVALGEIDLRTGSLIPTRPGVELVGASSDHLVLDVTDSRPPVRLGEELEFDTIYPAVSTGWASSCTTKVVLPSRESATLQ
jgi:predicted amino acid racemase